MRFYKVAAFKISLTAVNSTVQNMLVFFIMLTFIKHVSVERHLTAVKLKKRNFFLQI